MWLSDKRICLPRQELQETLVPPLGLEDPLEKERAIQSTPVFLPGESHEQRSLVGFSPSVTKSGT